MRPRRRRALARTAGVFGVVTQTLVGLMSIVIFPAALVSLLAGAAGVRLVGRDREASGMRFGVALLASLVGLVFGFASGPMLATATVSTGSFAAAWVLVQRLERERRTAFGIKHRDWERRQAELAKRRDALADGSVAPGERPPRAGDDMDDRDPAQDRWWEDLT